jgi:CYTH domain-containing protein
VAVEIERKFLVVNDRWREHVSAKLELKDGLISRDYDKKVRVRSYGDRATLTVKSRAAGARREEFEYEIPMADADALLGLCGEMVIEKTRHIVPWLGHTWEVDVYHGALEGVVIAEIELTNEAAAFERPAWIGSEVTGDPRYKKINMLAERLARRPLQAVG